MQTCRLDLAQLHGDETLPDCQVLAGRVIKAFRAGRDQPKPEWRGAALRGILIDSYGVNAYGGTGQVFDWKLVASYRKLGFPLILARLKPITLVRPSAMSNRTGLICPAGSRRVRDLKTRIKSPG